MFFCLWWLYCIHQYTLLDLLDPVEVLVARIWPKARSWGICVLYPWCYAWTSPWFFDNIAGARLSILMQFALDVSVWSWNVFIRVKNCDKMFQDGSNAFFVGLSKNPSQLLILRSWMIIGCYASNLFCLIASIIVCANGIGEVLGPNWIRVSCLTQRMQTDGKHKMEIIENQSLRSDISTVHDMCKYSVTRCYKFWYFCFSRCHRAELEAHHSTRAKA